MWHLKAKHVCLIDRNVDSLKERQTFYRNLLFDNFTLVYSHLQWNQSSLYMLNSKLRMLAMNKYYVLSCGSASGLYPWSSTTVLTAVMGTRKQSSSWLTRGRIIFTYAGVEVVPPHIFWQDLDPCQCSATHIQCMQLHNTLSCIHLTSFCFKASAISTSHEELPY